ncbi:hypothetical protein F0A17_02340 [Billgrantia pellis]|uniref:PAS domain-containing protein n=1 Tax=Billgrantia pellis TaxID=2606936 RepID=A0A7V7KHP7_9GAMM|nr:hypothetical protein [Halomonas pellis]KAA0014507.1 hypothetical protein F0A17_02340 [Halomonas pellis]
MTYANAAFVEVSGVSHEALIGRLIDGRPARSVPAIGSTRPSCWHARCVFRLRNAGPEQVPSEERMTPQAGGGPTIGMPLRRRGIMLRFS